MSLTAKRTVLLSAIVAAGVMAAATLFFMLGPPQLLAKSNQPAFCVQCHVMEAQYEAWMHAGAHRRKICVDCHLPNENKAVHYAWKALDGLKDVVVFYSGRVPERIKLTSHGAEVLQANCVRCHETAVMFIDADRKCWSCHRRVMHQRSGTMEII
ncbi:MAG: cytochrome c nitrite reductase small subunit [Thermodesulfovibrionales bacterium]